MSAYIETPDGHIQASWAARIGELHLQYKDLTKDLGCKNKFDATISITLLCGLLCYIHELLENDKIQESEIHDFFNPKKEEIFHYSNSIGDPPAKKVIECLRNATCHPLGDQSIHKNHKVTGFRSYNSKEANDKEFIEGFIFTHSPRVTNDGCLRKSRTQSSEPPYCLEIKLSLDRISEIIFLTSSHFSSLLKSHQNENRSPPR
jgi:hypothetical protein